MQRFLTVGLALVCICLLFSMSGASAQRMTVGDGGGGSSSAVPVSVANFPQVQAVQVDKTVNVTGSVAVTNLPAVQQVTGTVNVGNLPLDGNGDVKVAQPQELAVVVATYYCQLTGGLLPGGVFQLNQGVNFQPIGLPGVQTFISLNDDPASTGTTADCIQFAGEIASTGTDEGCVVSTKVVISNANVQVRMMCTAERNRLMQTISTLSTTLLTH